MKVLFLFPPNWSACVSGPHLALPLNSGALRTIGIYSETWDLTEEYYRIFGNQPCNEEINNACENNDIEKLDELYFDWEDSFIPIAQKYDHEFGLLTGFTGGQFNALDIKQLIEKINTETVFTKYFENTLKEKIENYDPNIVGISISSYHQIFPAVELILKLRQWLPSCKIVLGGNIVTRLLDTKSFSQLQNLVDKIVIYQGELSIIEYCNEVSSGIISNRILSTQNIDFKQWPIPNFKGLRYGSYPGGVNTISYVSARGCYYGKCSFCAIPAGWSKSGYSGSADGRFTVLQIKKIIEDTGINRIKFVDEAFLPSKIEELYKASIETNTEFYWEAYARVEKVWENPSLLKMAFDSGCRRLYFGLEISPDANRAPLNKNDKGNIIKIMEVCNNLGILIHLFCMVGHPNTSIKDSELTVNFLIENQELVDTADMVGFRLDRGTNVAGVKKTDEVYSDFTMNYKYKPTINGSLSYQEVQELEYACQEALWENVPRLLHPLYRIGKSWKNTTILDQQFSKNKSYLIKVA